MFSASEIFPRQLRTWAQIGTAVLSGALLVACGGGGGDDSSSGTVGNFATGPISGFGSIIVNGVHYEHDRPGVSISGDDDGTLRSSDLKLGMVVDISSGSIDDSRHSLPSSISAETALVGPIDAVDAANSKLTVLGQTVVVTATTTFDSSITGGLAGLKKDDVVGVHGLFDKTTGENTATRLEKKSSPPQFYRLRAVVSALDKTTKHFLLGGQPVDYNSVPSDRVPSNLADGMVVRARLETSRNVAGDWVATRLKNGGHRGHDHDHHSAEVEGIVSDFVSLSSFSVNGLPVDASKARFEPSSAAIKDGVRVEAEGAIVDGVLVADKVEVKNRDGRKGGGSSSEDFEFRGALSEVTATTITVNGEVILYNSATVYERGSVATLKVPALVEVKAVLNADKKLVATRIRFED